MADTAGPTTVYLIFGPDNTLAYVGITSEWWRRIWDHGRQPWIRAASRIELEHYPSREEARRRELELIAAFGPPHNSADHISLPDSADRMLPPRDGTDFLAEVTVQVEYRPSPWFPRLPGSRRLSVEDVARLLVHPDGRIEGLHGPSDLLGSLCLALSIALRAARKTYYASRPPFPTDSPGTAES